MNSMVTVIIPIYNVEDFLKECIESVLVQTYTDLQIILVNDGSTDASDTICKEFEKEDRRIEYYSISNSGVSAARNLALKQAKGRYIVFVDADDTLTSNSIEKRVDAMKHKNLDGASMGFEWVDENNNFLSKSHSFEEVICSEKDLISKLFGFNDRRYGYQGYLWTKIFKTEIIKKHQLRFDEKIAYNEDRLFIFEYFFHCNSVLFADFPVYKYRQRGGSAMMMNKYSHKMLSEMIAYEKMCKIIEKNKRYVGDGSIYLDACYSARHLYAICKSSHEKKDLTIIDGYWRRFTWMYLQKTSIKKDFLRKIKTIINYVCKRYDKNDEISQ